MPFTSAPRTKQPADFLRRGDDIGSRPAPRSWQHPAGRGRASGRTLRRPRAAALESRRQPALAIAGVLLVVACTALGAAVAARADRRVALLAVGRFVPQGAVITASDLRSSLVVPGDGLSTVPAGDAKQVVGRRAAVSLLPGTLLAAADVGSGGTLPPHEALVGASLAADQLPSTLAVGDRVLVVLGGSSLGGSSISSGPLGATGSSATGESVAPAGSAPSSGVLAVGTVADLSVLGGGPAAGASDLVTLEIPASDAAPVAEASASGDVSLAEIPLAVATS